MKFIRMMLLLPLIDDKHWLHAVVSNLFDRQSQSIHFDTYYFHAKTFLNSHFHILIQNELYVMSMIDELKF